MKKETLGKVGHDIHSKHQYEHELGELMPQESERYLKALHEAVLKGKKSFSDGDFFLEVCLKKERLMPWVLPRIIVMPRRTCPTPFYDQDCFKYCRFDDYTEYIWSVPSPEACMNLRINAMQLNKEDKELLKFVLDYEDGTLLKLCKRLNGEKPDSIILEGK